MRNMLDTVIIENFKKYTQGYTGRVKGLFNPNKSWPVGEIPKQLSLIVLNCKPLGQVRRS
jgi:hypothetical protein